MGNAACDRQDEENAGRRILVVEDDNEMRELLAEFLVEEGYLVDPVADGSQALMRLRDQSFAAIIMDKNMPGANGLDLLPGLRTLYPKTPVILISAFGDAATFVDALRKGASDYLFKPFRMEELLRVVRRALAPATEGIAPPLAGGNS